MTKEQIAKIIDGRQYRNNHFPGIFHPSEVESLKNRGLIAIYSTVDRLFAFGACKEVLGKETGYVSDIFIDPASGEVHFQMNLSHPSPYQKNAFHIVPHHDFGLQKFQYYYLRGLDKKMDQVNRFHWTEIRTSLPAAFFVTLDQGQLICKGCVVDVKDFK